MDIADILFHVHADLSAEGRADTERDIQGCAGVVSAHFSQDHPHMLEVAYDPRAVSSDAVLAHLRERGLTVSKLGL